MLNILKYEIVLRIFKKYLYSVPDTFDIYLCIVMHEVLVKMWPNGPYK